MIEKTQLTRGKIRNEAEQTEKLKPIRQKKKKPGLRKLEMNELQKLKRFPS